MLYIHTYNIYHVLALRDRNLTNIALNSENHFVQRLLYICKKGAILWGMMKRDKSSIAT